MNYRNPIILQLLMQRTIAEQEAREIEKSLAMDFDVRKKSMAKVRGGANAGHREGWSESGTS